jgi:hypothetical protein
MFDEDTQNPTPEETPEDVAGPNDGSPEGEGEGLTQDEIMSRIESGDFDMKAIAKSMVPKGEVTNTVKSRLSRYEQTKLKELGVESWEEAQAKLAAIREAEEEERSASEKLEDAQRRAQEYQQSHDALKAVVEAQANAMMEGVPDHLKPLIEQMEPAKRLEYLTQNRDKLAPRQAAGPGSLGAPGDVEAAQLTYRPDYNIPSSKGT